MTSAGATDGDPRNDRPENSADKPATEPDASRHELPSTTAAGLLRQLLALKTQPAPASPPPAIPRPSTSAAIVPAAAKPRRKRIPIRLRWRRARQRLRTWIRSPAAPRMLVAMLVVVGAITTWRWYQVQHPPGLIETIQVPNGKLTCLVVGGDGRWVATGSGTGDVSLWDRQRGRFMPIRSSSGLPISSLRFTTDQFLIAGGLGKRLQVWSLKDFEALDIPLLPAPITAIAVHPRRSEIVIGLQNGTLAVLDSVSGEIDEVDSGHVGWVKVIEFHPAGNWFVTGGADGKLIVRDGTSHEQSKAWIGHAADVSSLSISSDGDTLASADWSGIVKLWKMPDGELVHELPHPDGVSSVVIHGSRLVTAAWDGHIRVWSLDDGREIGSVATGQPVSAMSLAANGRHAVTVSPSNIIRFWRLP